MKIAVVGLGYVGLPLAVEFAKHFDVVGFDTNKKRIEKLKNGEDITDSVSPEELKQALRLQVYDYEESLEHSNFYIVTVPTPIDNARTPNLLPLESAVRTIGRYLKKGDYVVVESTVYPGVTEEICVPILEEVSGLKLNEDFFMGYSPERVSPGLGSKKVYEIKKIVSGSTLGALKVISKVYRRIIKAGLHEAPCIKVAEAAKVIENTQRDINIALVNELSMIFDRLEINTSAVLEAAATKWNFQHYKPGLVGGHCIGVDPYYLTYKAKCVGYEPKVILAGREVNDNMGKCVAHKLVKKLINKGHGVKDSIVTVLGVTFKENVPDIRNSKVFDIIKELESFGVKVQACDPYACPEETYQVYGVELFPFDKLLPANACVLAVEHDVYRNIDLAALKEQMTNDPVIFDVKGILRVSILDNPGFNYLEM